MKKFVLAAILILVTILSGCGNASQTPNEQKNFESAVVRIHYSPIYGAAIQNIMMLKNTLTHYLPEGVSVEWVRLESTADIRDSLSSAHLDIGALPVNSYFLAIENNIPITLLSAGLGNSGAIYSKNPEINSIDDLSKAKRIAIRQLGILQHFAFLATCYDILGKADIYVDKLFPIATQEMLFALEFSSDIECAILSFPDTIKAGAIKNVKMITDLTPATIKHGFSVYYVANADFYQKNPAIVQAFLNAQNEVVTFMIEHPKEAAELLATVFEIEAEQIEKQIIEMPPKMEITYYDELANFLLDIDVLSSKPKLFSELPNYADIPKAP
jgi:ABC-type nitrate/sulfonate/bicarbonate transport system substrate-binding protein